MSKALISSAPIFSWILEQSIFPLLALQWGCKNGPHRIVNCGGKVHITVARIYLLAVLYSPSVFALQKVKHRSRLVAVAGAANLIGGLSSRRRRARCALRRDFPANIDALRRAAWKAFDLEMDTGCGPLKTYFLFVLRDTKPIYKLFCSSLRIRNEFWHFSLHASVAAGQT